MTSTVSVLAPNGRRQTVKCTANTTILQILEEVCKKQGFKPEEYEIKHHNKILDTSMSFRFSGLPNNAQLELATATRTRVDSEITLAISLEDGTRVVSNCLPDETLWNVLLKSCSNQIKPDENPVVIYMRNEIYGEKLKETCLRSLGLTGGRAMMRVIHKKPEELKIQANISAPLPAKPIEEKEEKPFRRVLNTEKQETKKNDVDIVKLAREREKRKLESPNKTPEVEVTTPRTKAKVEPKEEAMEVDLEVPQKSEINQPKEETFVFLGERQAMLFSLESAKSLPAEDLPDDFFELTIDDAKKILGDIRRKRQEMENAVLMTSTMRDLEESKKQLRHLNRYKQSIIRVQFSDRTILQGSFKPSETIKDVKDFVKSYLEHSNLNFYLYTTPPKSILNEDSKLMEIGCVPGALLHLGTDAEDQENVCLKAEVRDKFTTNSMASLAASKLRREATRIDAKFEEFDDISMDNNLSDVNVPGPSSQPTKYERKAKATTEKVPKWFKPTK